MYTDAGEKPVKKHRNNDSGVVVGGGWTTTSPPHRLGKWCSGFFFHFDSLGTQFFFFNNKCSIESGVYAVICP